MSLHSDILSLFRANQSVLFLLNTACLAGTQQIPMLPYLFGLGPDPTIFRTRGEHVNHYATDEVTLDIGSDCHASTYNASRCGVYWYPLYDGSSCYNTESLTGVHSR